MDVVEEIIEEPTAAAGQDEEAQEVLEEEPLDTTQSGTHGGVLDVPGHGLAPFAPAEPVHPETAKLHLAIASAFKVFDHQSDNSIDVRELGTVVRSLGCVPSEVELREIILECEEEEPTGFITYERFEPVMTRILEKKQFHCDELERLREAFAVLGGSDDGTIDAQEIIKTLTEEGEPLTQDEIDEFMAAAMDPNTKQIFFEEHAMLMHLDPRQYGALYNL
ncbi:uncharacterized protein MONBRDRAFT_37236 [Monosiga brevicollis MX1]|uniref:EF-hand domain-containing protein n=1 Tax=Monosiga brevicollis TaxID=81824 RepID=A9V0G9_MONBE|nr:uncharacterized protein MONBRDRAFT_37236 [Monosiga brevicollis MX1]EDQ89010.1 predicted protein [Monosiga brevicollis MX1]|eukprot:XP_001746115.1 hypothetical protein [Monosiga brevicollis MX1]